MSNRGLQLTVALLAASTGMGALAGWTEREPRSGREVMPGIFVLTSQDQKPSQQGFAIPELADPYVTISKDVVIVSGTAQYHLEFSTLADLRRGGPFRIVWDDFYYPDGTPMEENRRFAHSWDMKPALWSAAPGASRLWDPRRDSRPPRVVWYGGRMRPLPGEKQAHWPEDNWSRDVFAFTEKLPGQWFSLESSLFSLRDDWPRAPGNFLGHRYGHQIVSVGGTPSVFYEEVTAVREDGSPAVTKLFMDTMASPFQARGKPVELMSPLDPSTGRSYPSALRETGAALVEGPLYFRFRFEGELWEAIGFSAGSYYGSYPSCFASRKVADGLKGAPYRPDLNDEGADLNDAGAELGRALGLFGGPGRPAVIVGPDGMAIPGPDGELQVLVHGYRRGSQDFRTMLQAPLRVERGRKGALRFRILVPKNARPRWAWRPRYDHCLMA